jgi:hypothetical protein
VSESSLTCLPPGLPAPVPEPDGLSAPYWQGLREGRLLVQRCAQCGTWQFGPEWICHHCHAFDPPWQPVAPRGRIFRMRERDAWAAALEGSDACFAPVLALGEAAAHPHNAARDAFVDVGGVRQPAPAPRFSRTPSAVQGPAPASAMGIEDVIAGWAS